MNIPPLEEADRLYKLNEIKVREKEEKDWLEECARNLEIFKPKLEKAIIEAINNGKRSLNIDEAVGQSVQGYLRVINDYFSDFGYYADVYNCYEFGGYKRTTLYWDIEWLRNKLKTEERHCIVFKDNPYVGENQYNVKILRKIIDRLPKEDIELEQDICKHEVNTTNPTTNPIAKHWTTRFKEWLIKADFL